SSALRNGQIDLLVFNPPYVPTEDVPTIPETTDQEDTWVDIALNGGPQGMDVTNRVLDQLDTILSSDGEAYILFCARNNPELVGKKFVQDHHNFVVQKVIHRKAGWEELSIYRYHKLP
ncbi:DEKNAAC102125, partial [Brettanomyces naardenensis]